MVKEKIRKKEKSNFGMFVIPHRPFSFAKKKRNEKCG
jgi:hypothetical protein